MSTKQRIILGVSGSIAAYRSADLVRAFIEKGARVSVVMTKSAEQFITPLTLSSLSGEKTHTSMFKGSMDGEMIHIDLAKQADAVVIAPASADIIGKLAHGMADDLLTCIALGTKAPIFLAPAMNTEMYHNKLVQENCLKLKNYGMSFINPIEGKLACGDVGEGHIADQSTIVDTVLQALK